MERIPARYTSGDDSGGLGRARPLDHIQALRIEGIEFARIAAQLFAAGLSRRTVQKAIRRGGINLPLARRRRCHRAPVATPCGPRIIFTRES
jgi:hypothetical protein